MKARKYKTERELLEILRERISFGTTQTQLANDLGLSRSYLNEILKEKKPLVDSVAERMGFKKVFLLSGEK